VSGAVEAWAERLVSAPDGPPGAVVLALRDGAAVEEVAVGWAERPGDGGPGRPITPDTIFDLGSITKVAVTTATVMSLVEAGRLDLDAQLSSWIEGFTGPEKERVTLRHLLSHRAGLWEWWPVYFRAREPSAAIEVVASLELRYPVDSGRHYSDLGFMLLGEVLQRATGDGLAELARTLVHDPLGLEDTRFLPPAELRPRIAATSLGDAIEREMVASGSPYPVGLDPDEFRGWRERTLVGEVNDGNAHHAFGGIAGHAGLFSTARDLSLFGQALAGASIWAPATIELFAREHGDPGQALGLWRRDGGFGHSGFPGTELLVVPDDGLVLVLLTNRLHAAGRARPLDADWRELARLVRQR
jgi:CubicO group peptidase (beta-lactamase class C family)